MYQPRQLDRIQYERFAFAQTVDDNREVIRIWTHQMFEAGVGELLVPIQVSYSSINFLFNIGITRSTIAPRVLRIKGAPCDVDSNPQEPSWKLRFAIVLYPPSPIYQGRSETGHIWWDLCNCDDCYWDRFEPEDEYEPKGKKKEVKKGEENDSAITSWKV